MKTIVILSNDPTWTYNLRRELLIGLKNQGYRVIIVVGKGNKIDDLKALGCEIIDVALNRHGKSIKEEVNLIRSYNRVFREIRPDVVLSFTIKPNLYGAFLSRKYRTKCIANITGLGTAVEYPSLLQRLLIVAYKISFRNIYMVFFQNQANLDFFIRHGIVKNNYDLLPGSGVNLSRFSPLIFPPEDTVEFVFISRIMEEKGINQYLQAAEFIRDKYPNTSFHICGFCESDYKALLEEKHTKGIVIYHGMVDDIRTILAITHCTVLPTYYPEGMSNVLLESAASARPLITTDRPGCKEIIDDGYNGFIIKPKDVGSLITAIERFLALSYNEKVKMGINSRSKVERVFDRQIVVDKYLLAIKNMWR